MTKSKIKSINQEPKMAIEKFPVEKSHVMMFSRSIGDSNKIYYDEDYAKESKCGGIIAPPTFVQSSAQFDPDYFLRPKEGKQWFGSARPHWNYCGQRKLRFQQQILWRTSCRAACLSQNTDGEQSYQPR